jgi:hypothetical protein
MVFGSFLAKNLRLLWRAAVPSGLLSPVPARAGNFLTSCLASMAKSIISNSSTDAGFQENEVLVNFLINITSYFSILQQTIMNVNSEINNPKIMLKKN